MKRILSLMIVLAVVVMTTPSFANPTIDKMKDSTKTVLKSPLQVRDHLKSEAKSPYIFSVPGGLLKGTFYMGKDIVTGTYDFVTAPIDMVRK
jgi:hypothetical protein